MPSQREVSGVFLSWMGIIGVILIIGFFQKHPAKKEIKQITYPSTVNPIMFGVTMEYWEKGKQVAVISSDETEFINGTPIMRNVTIECWKKSEMPIIMHAKQLEFKK